MANALVNFFVRVLTSRRARELFKVSPRHVFGREYDDLSAEVETQISTAHGVLPVGFDQDDKVVVHWYTKELPSAGLDYADINVLLRTGSHAESARLYAVGAYLQEALEKLPKRLNPSYRGSRAHPGVTAYTPGDIIPEKGFLSSSRNPRMPFPGEYYFSIWGKSGREIAILSSFKMEDEVLFPAGRSFLVTFVETMSDGSVHVVMEEK